MTTDLDAFDTTATEEVDALEESDSVATDAERRLGADSPGFQKLELLAALQDAKVSAAQNGQNYDMKFEVDVEGFCRLAIEAAKGKGGFDLTWNKLLVGSGAEIKALGSSRDADGEMHYRFQVHLPQSEISRSLGRIGTQLTRKAVMVLEPMQGSLDLPTGGTADLAARGD